MSAFSDRIGITKPKSVMQTDSMDSDLRIGLWNVLTERIWTQMRYDDVSKSPPMRILFPRLWRDYFKRPLDTLPAPWDIALTLVREDFHECQWYEAYNFVEFVAQNYPDKYGEVTDPFMQACNDMLKREVSAFRFVGGRISRITSEEEIAEIESALEVPDSLSPVRNHLQTALLKLSDREAPDYTNSVKESILAVEALCQLMTGDSKATLGQALKVVEDAIGLHGALKAAFSSLYGYSSQEEGIRHALLKEPTLDFEDAKFMLVACSAFVNYLVEKASKAGIQM